MAASLPVVAKHPNDLEARSNALYGAWLGGISLGAVGMTLHHKLCTRSAARSTLHHRPDAHGNSSARRCLQRVRRAKP